MGLNSSIDRGWINQNKTGEKSTTNMTQPKELSQLPPMRDYRVERKAPYKQSARNLSMNINIHIYYIKYLRWMWVRLWALSSTLDCEWDVTPPHSRHSWKLLRIPLECHHQRIVIYRIPIRQRKRIVIASVSLFSKLKKMHRYFFKFHILISWS